MICCTNQVFLYSSKINRSNTLHLVQHKKIYVFQGEAAEIRRDLLEVKGWGPEQGSGPSKRPLTRAIMAGMLAWMVWGVTVVASGPGVCMCLGCVPVPLYVVCLRVSGQCLVCTAACGLHIPPHVTCTRVHAVLDMPIPGLYPDHRL